MDRDHFKEQTSWLQEVLNESKNEMRHLVDERDKLKTDLATAQSDVVEFLKRFDLANRDQDITAQALAEANAQMESLMGRITQLDEANAQRDRLLDKICQLEEVAESLRSDNLSLKVNTEEAVKAGVKNFRSQFKFTPNYENFQAFFVNFGAQQVLTEVKELHPNLDLSTIKVDYPSPEEDEDGVGQTPADPLNTQQTNLLLWGPRIGFSCHFVSKNIVAFPLFKRATICIPFREMYFFNICVSLGVLHAD
ncbi:hypothetical protein Fot_02409 [Forsythia ovata]|uniref:Uncharacterized protein n=1 Tax=Forsythia ovata TaxID=205694 RepID=A0ABD1X6S0_9LAMI